MRRIFRTTALCACGAVLVAGCAQTFEQQPQYSALAATTAQSSGASPTPADLLYMETMLHRLGYKVDAVDGVIGPRTRDAVAEYQSRTGQAPTGEYSPALLAGMGQAVNALAGDAVVAPASSIVRSTDETAPAVNVAKPKRPSNQAPAPKVLPQAGTNTQPQSVSLTGGGAAGAGGGGGNGGSAGASGVGGADHNDGVGHSGNL